MVLWIITISSPRAASSHNRAWFLGHANIIRIDDVDVGIKNRLTKFADDTKISNSVLIDEDRESLRDDLHKISASFD